MRLGLILFTFFCVGSLPVWAETTHALPPEVTTSKTLEPVSDACTTLVKKLSSDCLRSAESPKKAEEQLNGTIKDYFSSGCDKSAAPPYLRLRAAMIWEQKRNDADKSFQESSKQLSQILEQIRWDLLLGNLKRDQLVKLIAEKISTVKDQEILSVVLKLREILDGHPVPHDDVWLKKTMALPFFDADPQYALQNVCNSLEHFHPDFSTDPRFKLIETFATLSFYNPPDVSVAHDYIGLLSKHDPGLLSLYEMKALLAPYLRLRFNSSLTTGGTKPQEAYERAAEFLLHDLLPLDGAKWMPNAKGNRPYFLGPTRSETDSTRELFISGRCDPKKSKVGYLAVTQNNGYFEYSVDRVPEIEGNNFDYDPTSGMTKVTLHQSATELARGQRDGVYGVQAVCGAETVIIEVKTLLRKNMPSSLQIATEPPYQKFLQDGILHGLIIEDAYRDLRATIADLGSKGFVCAENGQVKTKEVFLKLLSESGKKKVDYLVWNSNDDIQNSENAYHRLTRLGFLHTCKKGNQELSVIGVYGSTSDADWISMPDMAQSLDLRGAANPLLIIDHDQTRNGANARLVDQNPRTPFHLIIPSATQGKDSDHTGDWVEALAKGLSYDQIEHKSKVAAGSLYPGNPNYAANFRTLGNGEFVSSASTFAATWSSDELLSDFLRTQIIPPAGISGVTLRRFFLDAQKALPKGFTAEGKLKAYFDHVAAISQKPTAEKGDYYSFFGNDDDTNFENWIKDSIENHRQFSDYKPFVGDLTRRLIPHYLATFPEPLGLGLPFLLTELKTSDRSIALNLLRAKNFHEGTRDDLREFFISSNTDDEWDQIAGLFNAKDKNGLQDYLLDRLNPNDFYAATTEILPRLSRLGPLDRKQTEKLNHWHNEKNINPSHIPYQSMEAIGKIVSPNNVFFRQLLTGFFEARKDALSARDSALVLAQNNVEPTAVLDRLLPWFEADLKLMAKDYEASNRVDHWVEVLLRYAKHGEPRAANAIVNLLFAKNPQGESLKDPIYILQSKMDKAIGTFLPAAVKQLLPLYSKYLLTENAYLADHAPDAFAQLGEIAEPMLKALKEAQHPDSEAVAAAILGKLPQKNAAILSALLERLPNSVNNYSNWEAPIAEMRAIGTFGPKAIAASPALVEALKGRPPQRLVAAVTLLQIGDATQRTRALGVIRESVWKTSELKLSMREIKKELGRLTGSDQKTIDRLAEFFLADNPTDGYQETYNRAEALAALGEKAIPAIRLALKGNGNTKKIAIRAAGMGGAKFQTLVPTLYQDFLLNLNSEAAAPLIDIGNSVRQKNASP